MAGPSEQGDSEVIDWMVKVAQLIRKRRYNNTSQSRRTEDHIATRKAPREEAENWKPHAEYEWLVREANLPEQHDERMMLSTLVTPT